MYKHGLFFVSCVRPTLIASAGCEMTGRRRGEGEAACNIKRIAYFPPLISGKLLTSFSIGELQIGQSGFASKEKSSLIHTLQVSLVQDQTCVSTSGTTSSLRFPNIPSSPSTKLKFFIKSASKCLRKIDKEATSPNCWKVASGIHVNVTAFYCTTNITELKSVDRVDGLNELVRGSSGATAADRARLGGLRLPILRVEQPRVQLS